MDRFGTKSYRTKSTRILAEISSFVLECASELEEADYGSLAENTFMDRSCAKPSATSLLIIVLTVAQAYITVSTAVKLMFLGRLNCMLITSAHSIL
jgi:hypothetical protein